MKRFTVLAFAILLAAPGAFAASEAETTAADDGPVVIDWVGLRLKTPGGALYPQPDSPIPIIQEFNKALNIDLRAVKTDAFGAEEMNLLFATGEIPDHMLANQNNMLRYQDEGLLREIPLDMVKQHAPNLLARLRQRHGGGDLVRLPVLGQGHRVAVGAAQRRPGDQAPDRGARRLAAGDRRVDPHHGRRVCRGGAPVHLRRSRRQRPEGHLGHGHFSDLRRQLDQQPGHLSGRVRLRAHRTALSRSRQRRDHVLRGHRGVARLPALDERPVGGGGDPSRRHAAGQARGRVAVPGRPRRLRRRHLDLRAAQVPARHLVPEPVREGSQRHGGVRGPVDRRRLRADLGAAPGAVDLPRHRQGHQRPATGEDPRRDRPATGRSLLPQPDLVGRGGRALRVRRGRHAPVPAGPRRAWRRRATWG